jgi:serine/threonine-protein kinase RsbW
VEELTPHGHDDDIALIHVRRAPAGASGPPALHLRATATAEALVGVRSRLERWLTQVPRVEPGRRDDVVLAAYEAMANAVEHGYADRPPGELVLDASWEGPELQVTVTDFGVWRAPGDDPYRGRGLPLIRTLADHVAVTYRDDGTTVRVRWQGR